MNESINKAITDCPTNLLSDTPAGKDAFGSHERVAQAIATLVRDETGGKAIGLTGSWGSGKSTIVKILKDLLTNDKGKSSNNELVFVYDAWSHDRDPLRRSFLEELINFLSNNKWIDSEDWDEVKEGLAKRLKITETKQTSHLTQGGIALTISALLVPVGLALLSTIENSPAWLAYLGGFLTSTPFFVFLYLLITGKGDKKIGTVFTGEASKKKNVLALFVSHSEVTNRNETIETPDPTSLEFQGVFYSVLNEAIGTNTNRRLLVVIDNLDRVDPESALSIWSTMCAFFDSYRSEHKWMPRFWLIVPFDPRALKRLWGNNKSDGTELVKAFKDKTFQVIFDVSPPILSDWKNFFMEQLSDAFPKHNSDDFHIIYRLFSLERIQEDCPIVPRDIKLYINTVGVLHRQWGDYIPLALQALYVLCKEKTTGIFEDELIKSNFLNNTILGLINQPEWQKHLAALHFNINPDKAIQVLIQERILRAFINSDAKELQHIQNVSGFLEVCEQIIESNYLDWVSKESRVIATTAFALNGLEVESNQSWSQIWNWLLKGVQQVKQWDNLDEKVGNGIAIILNQCLPSHYEKITGDILTCLSSAVPVTDFKETPDASLEVINQWLKGIIQIVKAVHDSGHQNILKQSFHVSGGADFYVAVMADLNEETIDNKLIEYFVPGIEPQEVVEELITKCDAEQLTEKYSKAIELMMIVRSDWSWEPLVATLNQRLQATNNLNIKEISGCVGTLLYLAFNAEIPKAMTVLKQLSIQGHLAHHLYLANNKKDVKSISLCMFSIFYFRPEGNLDKNIGNSDSGISEYNAILQDPNSNIDVINEFAQLILKFNEAENFIVNGNTKTTTDFVSTILDIIVKREDAHVVIPSSLLITNYNTLEELLNEDSLISLISRLVKKANLLYEIEQAKFFPELSVLYVLAYDASKENNQLAYTEFLLNGIRAVEKETWLKEINEEGELLKLIIHLVDDDKDINLSTDFHDALLEHAKGLLDGQGLPSECQNQWPQVLNALSIDSKETFLRNLRGELLSRSTKECQSILTLYGNELMDSGKLAEEADEVVRRLFKEILNRAISEELIWLNTALKHKANIFNKSKKASQNDFKSRVKSRLTEEDLSEEALLQVKEIAGLVDIDAEKLIRKSKPANNDIT